MERKPETPKQREAFLLYFGLGKDRSLASLREQLLKSSSEKPVSSRTFQEWSAKFAWVERVQEMDMEVAIKAEALAIKEAILEKSKVLQFVKNVFIRANKAIVDGTMVPTVSDVKKAWEIARVELGLEVIPEEQQGPTFNIFLTKNQNILNVVHEASEKLKKALMEDTTEKT